MPVLEVFLHKNKDGTLRGAVKLCYRAGRMLRAARQITVKGSPANEIMSQWPKEGPPIDRQQK